MKTHSAQIKKIQTKLYQEHNRNHFSNKDIELIPMIRFFLENSITIFKKKNEIKFPEFLKEDQTPNLSEQLSDSLDSPKSIKKRTILFENLLKLKSNLKIKPEEYLNRFLENSKLDRKSVV